MNFNNTKFIYSALFLISILLSACGSGSTSSSGSTTAPSVPTGVVAKCGNNQITVSWSAVTGATSYDVYRSTVAATTGALIGSSATTSYVDTTGAVGTTYYYTVTAVNSAGASIASAEVSETLYKVLAGAMQGKSLALASNVTTFAGSSGFSGIPVNGAVGTNARFDLPQGMTTDGTYLYVADYLNNGIQRIDPATQTVTLFAGSPAGSSGYADGVGTAALFFRPYDITSDGTNLYVTEFNGCMIRKIVIATAAVSTFAGQSQVCSPLTNGIGTAAVLVSPQGITTDGTSLFVTENTAVRQIDLTTQTVSVFAGSTAGVVGHVDASGTAARFNNLEGITTDGTGTGATFNLPMGITTDGTNLYVTESSSGVTGGGDVIREIVNGTTAAAGAGVVTTLAGQAGVSGTADGTGSAAQFSSPWGITTYCGKLFIGDTSNSSIRQIQ